MIGKDRKKILDMRTIIRSDNNKSSIHCTNIGANYRLLFLFDNTITYLVYAKDELQSANMNKELGEQ